MGKRQRFERRVAFRFTKKLFLIASEGAETEPSYFEEFKLRVSRDSIIRVKLVANPNHKSHPIAVLKRLAAAAKEMGTKPGDELWLVIDRDAWSEPDLNTVCVAAKKNGFHVALSNPCFELWLYLHLKENRNFIDRHQCQRELENVCESYAKNGKSGYDAKSLIAEVHKAIGRAKSLDLRPQDPWPKTQATRVYLLVEKLLDGLSTK